MDKLLKKRLLAYEKDVGWIFCQCPMPSQHIVSTKELIINDVLGVYGTETAVYGDFAIWIEVPDGIFAPIEIDQKVASKLVDLEKAHGLHGIEFRIDDNPEFALAISVQSLKSIACCKNDKNTGDQAYRKR